MSAGRPGARFSASVMSRASATRSPASMRSTSALPSSPIAESLQTAMRDLFRTGAEPGCEPGDRHARRRGELEPPATHGLERRDAARRHATRANPRKRGRVPREVHGEPMRAYAMHDANADRGYLRLAHPNPGVPRAPQPPHAGRRRHHERRLLEQGHEAPHPEPAQVDDRVEHEL